MNASTLRFIMKLGAMLGKGPCSPVRYVHRRAPCFFFYQIVPNLAPLIQMMCILHILGAFDHKRLWDHLKTVWTTWRPFGLLKHLEEHSVFHLIVRCKNIFRSLCSKPFNYIYLLTYLHTYPHIYFITYLITYSHFKASTYAYLSNYLNTYLSFKMQ